jgi:hypothetical protein
MYLCVELFTTAMRPDPKYDLSSTRPSDGFRKAYASQVRKNCDVRKLMGVVDLNGNERK